MARIYLYHAQGHAPGQWDRFRMTVRVRRARVDVPRARRFRARLLALAIVMGHDPMQCRVRVWYRVRILALH